jgi:hypothetical protein
MLPITLTVGPLVAGAAAFYAASATPVSGVPLTLTGAVPAVPRQVLLTYGNEASARTLVVTGTNASGNSIQETLAVPSGAGGTVATTQSFASVTSALPLGSGWTAAASLGTNGVASSDWKIINAQMFGPTEVAFAVSVTGTVNWSIELTYTNPNNNANQMGGAFGNDPIPVTVWAGPTGLTAQAVAAQGVINDPLYAWRLTLNSGSGTATATVLESGMAPLA